MTMILRRILAWSIAAILSATPTLALTAGQRIAVLNGVQGWSFPGSSADLYFARNAGSCTINRILKPCASLMSVTRASVENCQWSDGHISQAASGVACITDLGIGIWQASTNTALWSRDMTQTAWVKVTMTAALNAIGIDNTANSATTLTATAGNATALQTLTISSTTETYSFYIERVTGSGTVNITENNGGTWTALTSANCVNPGTGVGAGLSTTAFVRCSVEATLANPVIGIRIVTNGDAVVVDYNQNEALAFGTPPILTTTTSVARAADVITLIGAAATAALNAKAARFETNLIAGINSNRLLDASGLSLLYSGTTSAQISNGTNNATATFGSGSTASLAKTAFGFDSSSGTAIANGGTKATTANAFAQSGTFTLGNISAGNRALNGYMRRSTDGPIKGQWDGTTQ